jgi:hypothetical protein
MGGSHRQISLALTGPCVTSRRRGFRLLQGKSQCRGRLTYALASAGSSSGGCARFGGLVCGLQYGGRFTFASTAGVCCKEFLSSGLTRGLGVGAGRSMLAFGALLLGKGANDSV